MASRSGGTGRVGRVLIIDDDKDVRLILQAFLQSDGHVVRAVGDVMQAQQILSKQELDVIVTDIALPGVNGVEFLRMAGRLAPHAMVIMITGAPALDTATEAMRLGACDYLTKPVTKNAIRRSVSTAARLKAADDERRRLEEANRLQLEQIELQNAELKRVASFRDEIESLRRHDLKSPLNVILGLPQLILLAGDNLTGTQRRDLETIERAGRKMLDMINRSLDLFKIEQGLYTLDRKPVELMSVLRTVIAELAPVARSKALRITAIAENLAHSDCTTAGEELLIYSLFANLVKNAVEASPNGEEITISFECRDTCDVSIRNWGEVPPVIKDRFFEKFVTAGKSAGIGLGTYSARLIAEIHGGCIRLDTSERNATTVTVCLPRHRGST